MDKAMNYLSLARKAGLAELGEEPVNAVAREQKAYLILVASDASDHTWRRAKSFAAGTNQQCLRLPYTKEDMGMAIGRQSLAIAALTDAALACSLVAALPQTEATAPVLEYLTEKSKKLRQRRTEAKAHQRNRRNGMKKN